MIVGVVGGFVWVVGNMVINVGGFVNLSGLNGVVLVVGLVMSVVGGILVIVYGGVEIGVSGGGLLLGVFVNLFVLVMLLVGGLFGGVVGK